MGPNVIAYSDFISHMFRLGILVALWGIYTELRKIAEYLSNK